MQIDLEKFEVKKLPKREFRLTPRIIELIKRFEAAEAAFFKEFNRICKNSPYLGKEKLMKEVSDKCPEKIIEEFHSSAIELDKERFREAYNEDLEDVKRKAFEGDRNSCLKLLKWDITYLEYERVRELIYVERQNKLYFKSESRFDFLEEVAKIIENPNRFHGGYKIQSYMMLARLYDPKKSRGKNLKTMENYLDVGVIPDERQFRRIYSRQKNL